MARGYYQIGGFHPQIQWFRYDDKRLAKTIGGDQSPLRVEKAPLELVLGIKRSGTSHLLLTESQAWDLAMAQRLPVPNVPSSPSTDFESLSPIEFWDAEELAKKLGTMKPKIHKGRVQVDNSQANKHYGAGGEDGIHRAAFEHGRLLYHVLHGIVDLKKYALNDASWIESLEVCSFVFNTWAFDERSKEERLANPKILDYGATAVDVPDLDETSGTMHIALDRNLKLQDKSRLKFKHGITEVLGDSAICSRLQAFLEPKTKRHPTILLVHGEEISRNVLRSMGIDTSAWQSGLKHLLGFDTVQVKNETGPSGPNDPRRRQPAYAQPELKNNSRSSHNFPYSRDDYKQRQHRARSRSLSPSRPRASNESYSSSSSQHHYHSRRSPPQSQYSYGSRRQNQHEHADPRKPEAFAPVYVVDIQPLYKKLMQKEVGAESVAAMTQQLKSTDDEGFCAGNEAVMLIEIWRSMISGSPIDDQRAFRAFLPIPLKSESAETKVIAARPPAGDSDEERDPNDIVQNPIPSYTDALDSDDYGSSDSGY